MSKRTLMFGWEFPPQISGGLGPACYGITNALNELGVKVIFVVPRLHAETKTGITLCDASEVEVHEPFIGLLDSVVEHPARSLQRTVEGSSMTKIKKHIDTITVPSSLTPYQSMASRFDEHAYKWWKKNRTTRRENISKQCKNERPVNPEGPTSGTKFPFTGKYGPQLLQEVIWYAEVAKAIAHRTDFDIIHAHDWMTFEAGIAAKNVSRKKLIIHVHSTEFDRAGTTTSTIGQIEKEGLAEADHIIAVSEWTKNVLMLHYGIDHNKISVVHNGIDTPSERNGSYRRIFAERVVTFLGRITYQKGPRYFINAAKKVLTKFPNTHFVMAGMGDMFEDCVTEVARLGISSQFHFPGFVKGDSLNKLWGASDLYVMPSVSEPFGITPLEAIAAGVPVIISKQSGVSEVVPHAIKINFWDTDALASAICCILKYDTVGTALSRNGREILETLTWNKAGKEIIDVYEKFKD